MPTFKGKGIFLEDDLPRETGGRSWDCISRRDLVDLCNQQGSQSLLLLSHDGVLPLSCLLVI